VRITGEAASVASVAGYIASDAATQSSYALQLRLTVAMSVGAAIVIGVLRILRGWPVQYLIMGGYVIVVGATFIAPEAIVGIAFDSGGVTTSTVTVPLVTALGLVLETQTDVVIFLTEEELVDPVMAAIHTAGQLDEHGTGVVFVVPVEQVAGIKEAIVRREPG